jgi:hypothetical protein
MILPGTAGILPARRITKGGLEARGPGEVRHG